MKILFFGEPLIRLTPTHHQKMNDCRDLTMYYGGSEINIAKTLAGFNIPSKILTGLPQDPIGDSFLHFLNQYHIDTSSIYRNHQRLGLYYLEDGFGIRSSQVYYDRQYTSIQDIDISQINFDELLKDITHFHFSGITVAVSKSVQDALKVILEEAKKRQIIISMDLNLRTKMISVEDAKYQFSRFAKYADYCFGIDPIMSHENNLEMFDRNHASIETIEKRMKELQSVYAFKAIFHTMRTVDKNNINRYYAYAYQDQLYQSVILETDLLERVGSGDAFVAGALYQIMNQASMQDVIDFAVASGTLKCTIPGDSMFESVENVQSLLKNNHEISR
ncbi:sugar kinase [Longibaculum muris]|uniref:sugar kinase n=1 Tax=Longibaculum muris TaxID=1796628 RepID=UPI0022DF95E4|nr:sugar kinase [Longibaculum muris]